jgi:hypothetical protein
MLLKFEPASLLAFQLQPEGAAPLQLFADELQRGVAEEQGQDGEHDRSGEPHHAAWPP